MKFDYTKLIWDFDLKSRNDAIELIKIEQSADSDSLMNINMALSELMNSLHEFKEPIDYSDRELEGKTFRFIMANGSLIKLLNKSDVHFKDKCLPILDVFTINTIMRMQIETFLMIFYLSFFEGTQEERNMRYDLYKLNGLKKQLSFEATSEYGKKKRAEIQNEYDEVFKHLNENIRFIEYDDKEQKNLLKLKHAKIVKTDVLFKESGLDKIQFDNIWSLFSNHTHSEYISDRQYKAIYKKDNLNNIDDSVNIKFHIGLTAKICILLIDKFESAKKVIPRLSKVSRVLIYVWGYALPNRENNKG